MSLSELNQKGRPGRPQDQLTSSRLHGFLHVRPDMRADDTLTHGEGCTRKGARGRVHGEGCTGKGARGRVHGEGCTGKGARGRVHGEGCTRKGARGRVHEEGCTRKGARGRVHEEWCTSKGAWGRVHEEGCTSGNGTPACKVHVHTCQSVTIHLEKKLFFIFKVFYKYLENYNLGMG